MSHKLSLQCYQLARDNPKVLPFQFQDLVDLLNLFEDGSPSDIRQFTFSSRTPELLIVDDEVDVAQVLETILIGTGYPEEAIELITSGSGAIDYVRREYVDIVLLDVKLVNPFSTHGEYLSGMHVLRAVREASPKAKVILISGFVTFAMVCEAILEIGASYHLDKPFKLEDVRLVVQWAVDQFQETPNESINLI